MSIPCVSQVRLRRCCRLQFGLMFYSYFNYTLRRNDDRYVNSVRFSNPPAPLLQATIWVISSEITWALENMFQSANTLTRARFPNLANVKVIVELHGMKAQCFSFGMKFRPLGKDQTPKIDLTFSPKCSIILTTIWTTFSPCTYLCAGVSTT